MIKDCCGYYHMVWILMLWLDWWCYFNMRMNEMFLDDHWWSISYVCWWLFSWDDYPIFAYIDERIGSWSLIFPWFALGVWKTKSFVVPFFKRIPIPSTTCVCPYFVLSDRLYSSYDSLGIDGDGGWRRGF